MPRRVSKFWLIAGLVLVALLPVRTLPAREYYFSALGNDQTGDGSLVSPWRSISKLNALDLEPGDQALFRAGDTFNGSIILDQSDSGVDGAGALVAPITIGAYGASTGQRAIIRSTATSAALTALNTGGIELRDLEFRNGGTFSSNASSGIEFRLDANLITSGSHIEHLRLQNVAANGFHRSGLALGSSVNVGYKDVEITGSQFYNNQFAGMEVSAALWTDLIHTSVRIDNVAAHSNPGYTGCSPHCGHGVVLGQVDGAIVENSLAYANGLVAGKGNVGIWTWQSNDVVIQRNHAYGNRSPLGGDGGGFDIDGGVTNSLVQYNTSSDNAGAGYLLAQFGFADAMQQNTFRYNLSVNDGIDDYGGITIWGQDVLSKATTAVFHNNTVIVDKSVAPNSRGAVAFLNAYHNDIDFLNNILVALNGADLVDGPLALARAQFVNNAYWTDGAPVRIGETVYASIAAWAQATQQEKLAGAFVGIEADPLLGDQYRPFAASPLVDAGQTADSAAWPSWWLGLPAQDLYGTAVPQGASVDVGAVERGLPGDFNVDGVVDAADYVVWRQVVQLVPQYVAWQENFGRSLPMNAAGFAHGRVPEPPSFVLLVLAGLVGPRHRAACRARS